MTTFELPSCFARLRHSSSVSGSCCSSKTAPPFTAIVCAWLLLGALIITAQAAPLKVVSWNLASGEQSGGASVNVSVPVSVSASVEALKKLNPDVILLQNVANWTMCSQVVNGLKPAEYNILICSSFRDASGAVRSGRQLAILAKQKAYFSWAEAWKEPGSDLVPGGYAFAAVEIGQRRAALVSVLWPVSARAGQRLAWHQQLLDKIAAVRNWEANRVDAFLLGTSDESSGSDPGLELLRTAGFVPVVESALSDPVDLTNDLFFVEPAGLCTLVQSSAGTEKAHPLRSCQMDLNAAPQLRERVAAATAAAVAPKVDSSLNPANPGSNALPAASTSMPLQQSKLPARTGPSLPVMGIGAFGIGFVLIWGFCSIRYRRKSAQDHGVSQGGTAASVPERYFVVTPKSTTSRDTTAPAEDSDTPVHLDIAAASPTHTHAAPVQLSKVPAQELDYPSDLLGAGLMAHLRQWLKQKLVRKLIADRAALLDVQRAATLKTLQVEERLLRIERQMQEQNQLYQKRIDELGRELAAAREENRELIRARIAQIKAEMETARARFEMQRQEAALDLSGTATGM